MMELELCSNKIQQTNKKFTIFSYLLSEQQQNKKPKHFVLIRTICHNSL
jgi:hypothetical protein